MLASDLGDGARVRDAADFLTKAAICGSIRSHNTKDRPLNPSWYHLSIGDGRRIDLPPEVCASLALDVGDTVIVRVDGHQATLSSVDHTIRRFQGLLAGRLPEGVSVVDELIAEREDAARRE